MFPLNLCGRYCMMRWVGDKQTHWRLTTDYCLSLLLFQTSQCIQIESFSTTPSNFIPAASAYMHLHTHCMSWIFCLESQAHFSSVVVWSRVSSDTTSSEKELQSEAKWEAWVVLLSCGSFGSVFSSHQNDCRIPKKEQKGLPERTLEGSPLLLLHDVQVFQVSWYTWRQFLIYCFTHAWHYEVQSVMMIITLLPVKRRDKCDQLFYSFHLTTWVTLRCTNDHQFANRFYQRREEGEERREQLVLWSTRTNDSFVV